MLAKRQQLRLGCAVGLLLSLYGVYIVSKHAADDIELAWCDLGEHMSCGNVLRSEYAQGFGVMAWFAGSDASTTAAPTWMPSNSGIGVFYYATLIGLSFVGGEPLAGRIVFVLVALANAMTIYLAYILYAVLHNLCLLCVAIYVVNLFNLLVVLHMK